MEPAAVFACVGRAGRVLRVVPGSDQPPDLPFAAPGAPGWSRADAAVLAWHGERFGLADGDTPVLGGMAAAEPYRLEVDVGDADILGFGAATGEDQVTAAAAPGSGVKLSTGAIAGIAVGGAAGVALIAAVVVVLVRRR